MSLFDSLQWTRATPEETVEIAATVRANPEVFHPDLLIDPPTAIERYSNSNYSFESYGLRAADRPTILVAFSDTIDWEKGRANGIEYTLVRSQVLQPGQPVLELASEWTPSSWLPRLRYWSLIDPADRRLSASHGIRGAFKELIGREDVPSGIPQAEQWSFLFEKYGIGKRGFEFVPYGSVAALGSIFLARSRYAELELKDSFNFGPR